MSHGQDLLTNIIDKLLPGEEVKNEEHIGERLRLDIYCPRYKLAVEYHGQQHFEYNSFFHNTYEDFEESQRRDKRKIELCEDQGIVLVVFRYDEDLSEDKVYDRLLEALKQAPSPKEEEKNTIRGNPYYELQKQRQRAYRKKRSHPGSRVGSLSTPGLDEWL